MFENNKFLTFSNVTKIFKSGHLKIYALDSVSFSLMENEVLSIVGESGSGKSTLGLVAIAMEGYNSGNVYYGDIELMKLKRKELRKFREKSQMIFQDPYESLNPFNSIYTSVATPLYGFYPKMPYKEKRIQATDILNKVGLTPPEEYLDEFPSKLSGGQRQRASIARSFILNPKFIVADEPTSMLDASSVSEILELLKELKKQYKYSMLYISHDIASAHYISDRMIVMNLGRIIELGNSDEIVNHPAHPYTNKLIDSVPRLGQKLNDMKNVVFDEKYVNAGIKGCSYAKICPIARDKCKIDRPELYDIGNNHYVACFYPML